MLLPDSKRWAEISPLLDELLELGTEQRSLRLGAIRRTDPVTADELAALLDADQSARDAAFLTGVADRSGGDALQPGLAGHRLGAYRLEAPIGAGGHGSVWRARRDDGHFDGAVAIKLLHLSFVGRTGAERFRREGAILARLAHPHIARLLDAGVSEGGQPYLVLELIEGERIDLHCNRLALGIEARLRLFLQVLDAVAHAHQNLVVHRDIKPSNVLVSPGSHAWLLDFGIAKLLEHDASGGDVSPLTRDGGRLLTPEYAAPEQLDGEIVTTVSDVYSLGLLLFELLCGQRARPVVGTGGRVGLTQTLRDQADSDAAGLAAFARHCDTSTDGLRRRLMGDLDLIVAKTLDAVPGRRYPSVDAMAQDLRRHLDHEPVRARPPSRGYRISKFVRRNRSAVAGAALLALAVTFGVYGTVTQAQRAQEQARLAARERDRALRELTASEATTEFMSYVLGGGGDRAYTTAQLLSRAKLLVERQYTKDQQVQSRLDASVAQLAFDAGQPRLGDADMQRALAAARIAGDPVQLGVLQCRHGGMLTTLGRFDEAKALLDAGRAAIAASGTALDRGDLARCLSTRARLEIERDNPRAALPDAERALQLLESPRPGQRMLRVNARNILADTHSQLGDFPRAIAQNEAALAELAEMGRLESSGASRVMVNFGVRLMNAGMKQRAAQLLLQGRDADRASNGSSSRDVAAEGNLATVYVAMGRNEEAVGLYEDALAAAQRSGSERDAAFLSFNSARAWCNLGRLDRCAARLAEGRAALARILPANHSMFGTIEVVDAQLHELRGQRDEARVRLRRAVALFDAAPTLNSQLFIALSRLALEEQRAGRPIVASALAERAAREARTHFAGLSASDWLGQALLAQARVLADQGDRGRARSVAAEAERQLRLSLGPQAPDARAALALLTSL